jgi:hypothetical protein
MNPEEIRSQFIAKFNGAEGVDGFYAFVPYTDGNIGFSIRKDLNPSDAEHASILSFYLPNKAGESDDKKQLIIDANYGEKRDEGVSIRVEEKVTISSPIDLISSDDYCYDAVNDVLLKKGDEITPIDLLNDIYNQHIKPTKPWRGFFLRTKIIFWRIILKNFFEFLSSCFHYTLLVITGDRYSYAPIMEKEVLNNIIVSHRFKDLVGHPVQGGRGRVIAKDAPKFNFLGYQASYWTIIFYSIVNLALYLYFEYINWKPPVVITLLKNSFLTLLYVVVSLWFLEAVATRVLKWLIKKTAVLSFLSASKRIRV